MNPNKSSMSHRLNDAFNDVAAGAQSGRAVRRRLFHVPSPSQLRALAHPDPQRPVSVHLPSREVRIDSSPAIAAAYKPTHGGYPSVGARA